MIKLFLNTTDNFLSNSVKTIFEKTESIYKNENINVIDELQKLQDNPLGCTIGGHSKFETAVKVKIKMILGIFFVLIPLIGFGALAYIASVELTYSFLLTFVVAILVASRMEEIVKRYVQTRALQPAY